MLFRGTRSSLCCTDVSFITSAQLYTEHVIWKKVVATTTRIELSINQSCLLSSTIARACTSCIQNPVSQIPLVAINWSASIIGNWLVWFSLSVHVNICDHPVRFRAVKHVISKHILLLNVTLVYLPPCYVYHFGKTNTREVSEFSCTM